MIWAALDALKADPDGAPVDETLLTAISAEQAHLAEALTGPLWLHAPGYGSLDERLLAVLWLGQPMAQALVTDPDALLGLQPGELVSPLARILAGRGRTASGPAWPDPLPEPEYRKRWPKLAARWDGLVDAAPEALRAAGGDPEATAGRLRESLAAGRETPVAGLGTFKVRRVGGLREITLAVDRDLKQALAERRPPSGPAWEASKVAPAVVRAADAHGVAVLPGIGLFRIATRADPPARFLTFLPDLDLQAAVDQGDPDAVGRPTLAAPRPWWRFWG